MMLIGWHEGTRQIVGHVDCEKLRASVEAMTKDP